MAIFYYNAVKGRLCRKITKKFLNKNQSFLIDNRCLSSYEQACTYLCRKGLLVSDSKKSGRIYFLARKKDLKSTIDGGKI